MTGRIFLIHWNATEAEELANRLRADSWTVGTEAEDGYRAGRLIKKNLPDAVVIYLTLLPSHGRETAAYLRSQKATRGLPIVFVDGNEKAVTKTKAKVPDAIFTTSAELNNVLAQFARTEVIEVSNPTTP